MCDILTSVCLNFGKFYKVTALTVLFACTPIGLQSEAGVTGAPIAGRGVDT